MKLDKRVKENALIGHCFNAEELKQYIGKECYFTDNLEDFSDLINPFEGVLKAVSPDAMVCYVAEAKVNGSPVEFPYCFCLPAVFVVEEKPEEKKLRPFTLAEFQKIFTIGRPIMFRKKGEVESNRYLMLIGYWNTQQSNGQTFTHIHIGYSTYTLRELFEEYEWQEHYTEDFKPFGVEE